jgi:hypothetical protein
MTHRITPFLIALPVVFLVGLAAVGESPAPDAKSPEIAGPELSGPKAESPAEALSLMERGARMLMQGILDEVGPQLGEMRDGMGEALREAEPAIRNLLAMIDDLRNYEAPVMLPNGDILLHRRDGAPPPPDHHGPAQQALPGGQIEL